LVLFFKKEVLPSSSRVGKVDKPPHASFFLPKTEDARVKFLLAAYVLALPSVVHAQTLYVTDQQDGVTTLDAATLAKTGEVAIGGKGPRGVAVTADGKFLLVANQASADLSIIDRASGVLQARVPIGPSTEMVRVQGHTAFATYEPPADRGGLAHIAVVDIDTRKVVANVTSGHETEGLEFSTDGKYLLVTNEGDNTVTVYNRPAYTEAHVVKTDSYGNRPRGIKRLPDGSGYIVTLEFSDKFLVLDKEFNVVKAVATAEGPYGIAFSPDGRKLFVAAAKAGLLQAFDARTYDHVGDVKVGRRCWHFTFTPDGSRIVAACGRSGALFVVDPSKMEAEKPIEGFKVPWGIVAYPLANGTLESK
jgi:YVTN family beta-propeller protein